MYVNIFTFLYLGCIYRVKALGLYLHMYIGSIHRVKVSGFLPPDVADGALEVLAHTKLRTPTPSPAAARAPVTKPKCLSIVCLCTVC